MVLWFERQGSLLIEKTLTGWQLTDGKERALFGDKKQAVYCGIRACMGMEKVKIPKELDEKKVNALRNIVDSVFHAINATLTTNLFAIYYSVNYSHPGTSTVV